MPDDPDAVTGSAARDVIADTPVEPLATVWQFADALLWLHGDDAACWALGYMVTAVQQGKPQDVRDMKNVFAAIIEMSRTSRAGESIN